jgi:hypothetical protein
VDCQKRRLFEQADDYIVFRIYRDKDLNPIGSANRYRVDGDLVLTY